MSVFDFILIFLINFVLFPFFNFIWFDIIKISIKVGGINER